VNSLPKTATRQRRDCDLNPDPSAPEYSTLTSRLLSHPPVKMAVTGNSPNGLDVFCVHLYDVLRRKAPRSRSHALHRGTVLHVNNIVLCCALERPVLHHRATFCGGRSYCCRVIAVFRGCFYSVALI